MAALDFPASPTNGQVYANWIYSTSKGAWQAKPITGKVTTSAVAPSAPTNGDEWFNTNDGNLYVYYTDVDGSQWVQVKSDATLSSTLGNRVTTLETYPSGLVPVVPSSITVSSGTGSVAADGTITFSGAGEVRINNVFSSTYANYKMVFQSSGSSANTGVTVRMRSAGTDYTTANQGLGLIYWGYPSALTNVGSYTNSSCQFGWVEGVANSRNAGTVDIFNPFATVQTTGNFSSTSYVNAVGGFTVPTTTSYDGLTVGVSGTFSGTIKIYGYR